jgi:hypothetical protein
MSFLKNQLLDISTTVHIHHHYYKTSNLFTKIIEMGI